MTLQILSSSPLKVIEILHKISGCVMRPARMRNQLLRQLGAPSRQDSAGQEPPTPQPGVLDDEEVRLGAARSAFLSSFLPHQGKTVPRPACPARQHGLGLRGRVRVGLKGAGKGGPA